MWSHTSPWVAVGTTLDQADYVANGYGLTCPSGIAGPNMNTPTIVVPGQPSPSSCESYYNDTRFGWSHQDRQAWPGWDLSVVGNGMGTPLTMNYANHAYLITGCTDGMKEVGLVYDGKMSLWQQRLGDLAGLHAQFDAQVTAQTVNEMSCPNGYEQPFNDISTPWAYLTADLRVNYVSGSTIVRSDILSVHFYNAQSFTQNYIFWHTAYPWTTQGTIMLNPTGAGLSAEQLPVLNGGYKTIRLDMKGLYNAYFSAPAGFSTDDATIVGFDVYGSLRGVDLNYSIKNVALMAQ